MEDGEYTLLDYVSSVAAFSSILYYATGWPLVWRVTKRRDTGIISTFPYVALLTNCTVWTLYGKLADNFVLKLVNFVGASHQIVYILVLYYYSKSKRLFNMQLLYSVMFIAGIFSYSYLNIEDKKTVDILGVVGSCLSIVAYASPLSAMGEVISTKSTASMNFILSLANLLLAIEWSVYGYFLGNMFVAGPNVLGLFVSIAQLALFYVYPNHPAPVLPP